MIDLSYLTEEEQEMIMTVLKRDVELKKANEERVKQLQKLQKSPEADELKYLTGDWFYDAKSQRHQDRIHGSDIIMASMKQRKPMTVDVLAQSWRDQPSRSNNVMTPKMESSGTLKESRSLEGTQQGRLSMRTASRPRHNPFNTEPMDLDHEETDCQLTYGTTGPGANKASAEVQSPLKSHETVKMETKTEVSDTLEETVHRQKPIPKKRTRLYKLQSTVSDSTRSVSSQSVAASSDMSTMSLESTPSMSESSDTMSTMSMQSMSTSSGIRSPPPRGILKHNSSCSSSGSKVKGQRPQPLKRLGLFPAASGAGQILDEHTISEEKIEEAFLSSTDQEPLRSGLPKSRLPVRLPLSNPVQTAQEKSTILPKLNLSDTEHKTTDVTHIANPKYDNNSINWSAKQANLEMSDETMKEPLTIPSPSVRSTLEAYMDKELSTATVPQASLPRPEKGEKMVSKTESEKAQEQGDRPQDTVVFPDHHGCEAINTTDASSQADASYMAGASQTADVSLDCKSSFSPTAVNIKRMHGETRRVKTETDKHPCMVQAQSPQPSEEQGASIAKVLEWFSKSLDSSDIFDHEDNVQDMDDDMKMEDIDFENETDLRTKRVDNVYVIIPRQSEEKTPQVNNVFLKGWGKELNGDTPLPVGKIQGVGGQRWNLEPLSLEPLPVMAENATHRKMDSFEKAGSAEKVVEMDSTEGKLSGNGLKENITHMGAQTPKTPNLLSFSERGITGPTTLVSRSGISSENDNKPQKYCAVGRDNINYGEEMPKSLVAETKKQVSLKEILNVDESGDVTQEHLNKHGTIIKDDDAKDMQPPWSYANKKKDEMVWTSFSGANVIPLLQKSRSTSLNREFVLGGKSSECENETWSNNRSEGEYKPPAKLNLSHRSKSEQKESEVELQSPPSPIPLAKQGDQEQNSRSEKIKRLRSFWEKEKWQHRIYFKPAAADDVNSSVSSATKLNKRLSKSEFDLRSVGAEIDDELDSNVPGTNFIVLQLRDRTERSIAAESIDSSQFKTLRDFWAGSSEQSSSFGSKIERPLLPKVNQMKFDAHNEISEYCPADSTLCLYNSLHPNQSDKINPKGFGNENGNTKPAKTQREFQASLKEETAHTRPDSDTKNDLVNKPSGEADLLELSHFPRLQGRSQACLKDTGPTPLPSKLNMESQARTSRKGIIHGKRNSLQRATSMFEVCFMDNEDQGRDLHLQSKKAPETNLPPLRMTTEAGMSPSRKMSEANLQLTESPESSRKKEIINGKTSVHTSGDTFSQHLVRSFVPGDYHQDLEGTEDSGTYVSDQTSKLVCTAFQRSPETVCNLRCSSVQACTALCTEAPCGMTGSLELHPSVHTDEDLDRKTVNDTGDWTHSQANSDKESLVQGALRRAAARPVYHKSLENLTAGPIRPRKSNQSRKSNLVDDFQPHAYDNCNTPSPPSSSFSDPERLKNLSKSVPSFLLENDGRISDCSSDCSCPSSTHWRNGHPPSSNSGMASVSSVSGSVLSVCSTDFTSVEVQGTIQFSISYVERLREFNIFVVQCQNLAIVDPKRRRTDPYVKSYLVPDSANLGKRKTSVKKRTLNPTYKESLMYRVQMEYLRTEVLYLSVWHNDMFGRNCFLGQTEVDLSTWDFGNTDINSFFLKPRTPNGDQPADNSGEMRLAVRYLPQVSHARMLPNSGEVHIWIKNCKNLPLVKGAPVDPYLKCVILPDTSKKGRQKTRVLKKTANPVFNHTMVYDGFGEEDLKEACVELTVWDQNRLANRLIGGLRLSLGTGSSYGVSVTWMDSTAQEVALWERMMNSPHEWIEDVLPLRRVATAKTKRK